MHFCRRFLSFLRDILMTCMVMVLPPPVIRPALMFLHAALAIDTGFTP